MKRNIIIIMCLLLAGLTSCDSWLDVKPETEQTMEDMFARQQGFQDALIGGYLKFKANDIYGAGLVYGNIEYLAQHWDYNVDSQGEGISRYNYKLENVEAAFSSVYQGLYRTIAELNMMLQNIDGAEGCFEKGMYGIIKGEALAMRAYCHLDVLRIFGPMPGNVGAGVILPYVRTASIAYHPHHTYAQFTACLEEDLLEAEKLLKPYDPVIDSVSVKGLSISATDFLQNRQTRFNYYAVKALQARFYLWLGGEENRNKALACAKEVIGAQKHGSDRFRLGNSDDLAQNDYSFTSEHILAIADYRLYEKAQNAFTGTVQYKKEEAAVKNELFQPGTTDIRLQLWNEQVASNAGRSFTIRKLIQKEEKGNNQIPLIRLSEMYFIAMECAPLDEANAYFEKFCIARDIPVVQIPEKEEIPELLKMEYNREFYGEGQAFYAFKRYGVKEILWAMDEGNEETYVVPLPREEISYK